MRFGLFSVADHYPNDLPRTVPQLYNELLERAQFAEELGYESFWVAEHHFHEYGAIPAPPVWMSAAAARTTRIRLGVAVSVLPFHNPLIVAEEYAMLDVLSCGRLEFGVGSGYLKHEFEGFGIAVEEKQTRFDEALDIIKLAWFGDRFSYQGRFNTVADLKLQVAPLQRPHPPIFMAVLRHEAAPYVGARGYPLMTIPYARSAGVEQLAAMIDGYRRAYAGAGHHDPAKAIVACALHTYVSDNTGDVERYAKPAMERYVRSRLYATSRPFDLLDQINLIAAGTPERVIEVVRLYERAGFNLFLNLADYGGMSQQAVMRSMERFARDVMPAFR
jgi:alkanesulfonate monooxygenase SsuD/methylene tetrahydromethanopterin reductase-like flavin-dependent oxidoreductase (luciferase family)